MPSSKHVGTGPLAEGGFALSYTAMELYRHCPAKFWYKYLARGKGVYTPGEWTPEMSYGKFWHALYQSRHNGANEAEQRKVFGELAHKEGFETINSEFCGNLIMDLDWYFDQTKDMKAKVLFCEDLLVAHVQSEATGLTHNLIGIPDLVAEIESDWGGGYYIIDHKTFKAQNKAGAIYRKPPEQSILRNKHGRQMPSYFGLWNLVNPNCPIFDGIINFVPQNITQIANVIRGRKGNQAMPAVHREFVFHNDEFVRQQINRWVSACDEIALAHKSGFSAFQIADNGDACIGWSPCQFLELCEGTSKTREDMLEHAFERRA